MKEIIEVAYNTRDAMTDSELCSSIEYNDFIDYQLVASIIENFINIQVKICDEPVKILCIEKKDICRFDIL